MSPILQRETVCASPEGAPSGVLTVETLIGEVEVHRPYFYCRHCHRGRYPLDESLDLCAGRIQLDVQQAAADLATELPYDTASTVFGHLSGLTVSSERMHTLTNQAAEGLSEGSIRQFLHR